MKYFCILSCILWVFFVSCKENDTEAETDDGLIFNVPRLETTSGASILEDPAADRGGIIGLCDKFQVYCNGQCLSVVGEQSGNCTLLQNNIGVAESIAVDDTNLYYTAMDSEILRMDLASLEQFSLVTGLERPTVLYPTGDVLYFGNNPSADAGSDVRVIFVGRTGATVLTEHVEDVFDIALAKDTLLVGAGLSHHGPLYSVPRDGGRWTKIAAPDILHFQVSGNTLVFSMNTETESGIFTSSLSDPETYTQIASGNPSGEEIRDFFVEGDFVYWFASKAANTARAYTKVSLLGGQKQEMQAAGSGILLAHNAAYVFYSDSDPTTPDSDIVRMPLNGGEAVVLGTYEPNELQAAVADTNSLYAALGYSRTGGIVRFDVN